MSRSPMVAYVTVSMVSHEMGDILGVGGWRGVGSGSCSDGVREG